MSPCRSATAPANTATQSFTIGVTAPAADEPPIIVSQPTPTTVLAGQTYTYAVDAIDPAGKPLTYLLTTAPAA